MIYEKFLAKYCVIYSKDTVNMKIARNDELTKVHDFVYAMYQHTPNALFNSWWERSAI